MCDDDARDRAVLERAAKAGERPLELDQEGGDDWDILPEEWREEWVDAGRVAVAAVKKARRLTRPRTHRSADPSPVRCTHEGGEWPGLDRCADCGKMLEPGDPS